MTVTSGFLQIQRDLLNGEVSVERSDLLAHDKEMFDKEELPVYLSLWRKYNSLFNTSDEIQTLCLLSQIKPSLKHFCFW